MRWNISDTREDIKAQEVGQVGGGDESETVGSLVKVEVKIERDKIWDVLSMKQPLSGRTKEEY